MYAISVCLNPARDMTIKINGFTQRKTNRAESAEYRAGGKGINVARALKRMGAECTVVGFSGGTTGEYIEKTLCGEGIEARFVKTTAETRTNIKLLNNIGSTNEYSEINLPGGPVTEKETEALIEKVWKTAAQMCENHVENESGYIIMSGSSPQGVEKLVYNSIIDRTRDLEMKTVCDCDGILLKNAIKAKPFLIKPNIDELCSLLDKKFLTKEEACGKCDELSSQTGVRVLLSLGAEGAYYTNGEGTGVYEKAERIEGCNPNGAGDTLLAAFLRELSERENEKEALSAAQAYVRKYLTEQI